MVAARDDVAGTIVAEEIAAALRMAAHRGELHRAVASSWPGPDPAPHSCRLQGAHLRTPGYVTVVVAAQTADGADYLLNGEVVGRDAAGHADRARGRLASHKRKQLNRGGRVWPVPALGMVLRDRGLDERILGLRLLHKRRAATAALQEVGGEDGPVVGSELLGHRLGKRATVRLHTPRGSVIAKLYKSRSPLGRRSAAAMKSLRGALGGEDPRIPRVHGESAAWNATFMEDVPGDPGASAAAAGRALGALHAADVELDARHSAACELEMLDCRVRFAAAVRPDMAELLSGGLDAVFGALAAPDPSFVPGHRDFHPDQVLGGDAAAVIDFDTAAMCDPGLDVGNYLAYLDATGAGASADAFLAGYETRRPLPRRAAAAYRRAAQLRLACLLSCDAGNDDLVTSLAARARHG